MKTDQPTYKTSEYQSNYPMETRISDRIRRRILDQQMSCDCSNTANRSAPVITRPTITTSETQSKVNFDDNASKQSCPCKKTEIPYKPDVYLQPITEEIESTNKEKVQSYDYNTRYSREFVPESSIVQKIPESSVKLDNTQKSEGATAKKMVQRDREAVKRGNDAWEKEKIKKDYQQLVKKLPLLRRQENLVKIGQAPQEFHISEDRRRLMDQERQNTMSNVYENAFKKPPEITLPKIQHPRTDNTRAPYKTITGEDKNDNLPQWDVDDRNKKGTTSISREESELLALLEKLRAQRERLSSEMETLPESGMLSKVLGELTSIEQSNPKPMPASTGAIRKDPRAIKKDREKRKNSRQPDIEEKVASKTDNNDSTKRNSKSKSDDYSHKRKYQEVSTETSSSSSNVAEDTKKSSKAYESKAKRPRNVIILQNTSTQTSPKVTRENTYENNVYSETSKSKTSDTDNVSKSQHKPLCNCYRDDKNGKRLCNCDVAKKSSKNKLVLCKCGSSKTSQTCSCCCKTATENQEVCEIVIKISEDQKPRVQIKSPKKPTLLNDCVISDSGNATECLEDDQNVRVSYKTVELQTDKDRKSDKEGESRKSSERNKRVEVTSETEIFIEVNTILCYI